ncbi:hypothetical protein PJI16_04160 [Nitrospira sp. MA-1]|nr:hypothetical protein [Nitrospira sp. MA-1]
MSTETWQERRWRIFSTVPLKQPDSPFLCMGMKVSAGHEGDAVVFGLEADPQYSRKASLNLSDYDSIFFVSKKHFIYRGG